MCGQLPINSDSRPAHYVWSARDICQSLKIILTFLLYFTQGKVKMMMMMTMRSPTKRGTRCQRLLGLCHATCSNWCYIATCRLSYCILGNEEIQIVRIGHPLPPVYCCSVLSKELTSVVVVSCCCWLCDKGWSIPVYALMWVTSPASAGRRCIHSAPPTSCQRPWSSLRRGARPAAAAAPASQHWLIQLKPVWLLRLLLARCCVVIASRVMSTELASIIATQSRDRRTIASIYSTSCWLQRWCVDRRRCGRDALPQWLLLQPWL